MAEWKGCVTAHRGILYLKIKDGTRWVERSQKLPDSPENRKVAARRLAQVRDQILNRAATLGAPGPATLRAWSTRWIEDRRRQGLTRVDEDLAKLKDHVLEVRGQGWPLPLGDLLLEDIRARHLVEVVEQVRAKGLAPRTVRNVYYLAKALFRDAEIAELLPPGASPAILTKRQLGKVRDARPGWRATAVFTRGELEQLVSDPQLPPDRRVWNALLGLGMLRTGEAAGLRWRSVQPAAPLGRLVIATSYDDGTTKTEVERWMPAHPTLAAILAEWKLSGWEAAFGRAPAPDDLVVPVTEEVRKGRRRPTGAIRDRHFAWKRLRRDLLTLGLRHRRAHDLRRTGITLARAGGADKDRLRRGTHGEDRDVLELYTSVEWELLCGEVAKLQCERLVGGTVLELAR